MNTHLQVMGHLDPQLLQLLIRIFHHLLLCQIPVKKKVIFYRQTKYHQIIYISEKMSLKIEFIIYDYPIHFIFSNILIDSFCQ